MFTGNLSRPAVAEAFASADVFAFPSRTDTAGNVVLEAQASGLPVVVSDAGGPRENLVPGETGLVCEGSDPEVWADAVGGLLTDAARRARLATAARAYANRRRWDRSLAPLFETYRDVHAAHVGAPLPRPVPDSHGRWLFR